MGNQKSKIRIKGSFRRFMASHAFSFEDVNRLVDTDDYENVTALWLAVRYNDHDLVRKLLKVNAKVNYACGSLHMTPLHMAAYNHNVEIVQSLLEAGANPNLLDRWNYTPLMYAAIYDDPAVVESLFQLLINHGCTLDFGATINDSGISEQCGVNRDVPPLRSNSDNNYITYVREPLGPTSGTALHLAVQNPFLPSDVLLMLFTAGAGVNMRNLHGQTPLMCAILDIYYDYHSEVKCHAEMLIKHGADLNACDIRGWTCLHYAARHAQLSCMELLLRNNAECNIPGHHGETPLWLLLGTGDKEGASYLIQNGCHVNEPMKSTLLLLFSQNTNVCRFGDILPIEFAICNRFYDVAKLLLLAGCRINNSTCLWISNSDQSFVHKTVEKRREEFMNFMFNFVSRKQTEPVALKDACRMTIRDLLQQGISFKLETLHLPSQIKDYLCLKIE